VVDEFTRECVALEVRRSTTAEAVAEVLVDLFTTRGVPGHIRSDNGPEFIAATIRRLADLVEIDALYIEPGSPWENGYAESFHSRLRDELLNAEVFTDVADARSHASSWRNEYNHHRPHSSLGYVPPANCSTAPTLIGLGTEIRGRSEHGQGRRLITPPSTTFDNISPVMVPV